MKKFDPKVKFNTSMRSVTQAYHSEGEDCEKPVLVEPGESLPLALMIEMQMNAGVSKQVQAEMLRMYHFGPTENIPDEFLDPYQDFNVNIQVAHQLKKYLEGKIRENLEMQKEAKEKAKEIVENAKNKEAKEKAKEKVENAKNKPEPETTGTVEGTT